MATWHDWRKMHGFEYFQSLRRDTPHGNTSIIRRFIEHIDTFNRSGAIPLMATASALVAHYFPESFQSLRRDTPHGNDNTYHADGKVTNKLSIAQARYPSWQQNCQRIEKPFLWILSIAQARYPSWQQNSSSVALNAFISFNRSGAIPLMATVQEHTGTAFDS